MAQYKIITNNKEIQDDVIPDSISISQQIGNRTSNLSFRYDNTMNNIGTDVALNRDITVTYDGETIFGGTITEISASSLSDQRYKTYNILCNDYSHNLSSILVNTRTAPNDVSSVISNLLEQYTGREYTLSPIAAPPPLASVTLLRVSVKEALDKITQQVNYTWYVRPNKTIVVARRGTNISNFSITPSNQNYLHDTPTVTEDTTQIRNSVFIKGSKQAETTAAVGGNVQAVERSYTFKGDGAQIEFIPPVVVNGIAEPDTGYTFGTRPRVATAPIPPGTTNLQSIPDSAFTNVDGGRMGIYGLDNQSGTDSYQVLWNSSGVHHGVVFSTAPANNVAIRVFFNREIQILATANDITSINQYGRREYFDIDTSLSTLREAQERADAEISTYKDPIKNVSFTTYATNIVAGETLPINIPTFDINDTFLVQSINLVYFSGTNDDDDVILINNVVTSSIKEVYFNDLIISLLSSKDVEEDTPDIEAIENIYDLAVDTTTLTETFGTPTKQTNTYVWSTSTNTPTTGLVRAHYNYSKYDTAQASLSSINNFVITPTVSTEGVVTAIALRCDAVTGANRYIVEYAGLDKVFDNRSNVIESYLDVPVFIVYQGQQNTTTLMPSNFDAPILYRTLLSGFSNFFMTAWSLTGNNELSKRTKGTLNYVIPPTKLFSTQVTSTSVNFSWRRTSSKFPITYTIGRFRTGETNNLNAPDAMWVENNWHNPLIMLRLRMCPLTEDTHID